MKSKSINRNFLTMFLICIISFGHAEDGYRLWLRYDPIQDAAKRTEYASVVKYIVIERTSPTLDVVERELKTALVGLLGATVSARQVVHENGALVMGTPSNSPIIASLHLDEKLKGLGDEGFYITSTTVKGKNAWLSRAIRTSEFYMEHFILSSSFKLCSQFKIFRCNWRRKFNTVS